eukprot:TRINITY_DN8767_c1_g1_i1.p1 TRINITY_DN8767_c1_g1~~TRINITY_DN8767_c1_g1_i1.p1  ORF type:complete len:759 (+),score=141.81 TRINITY_DN8767_c1_g1_i1:134-2410(+)
MITAAKLVLLVCALGLAANTFLLLRMQHALADVPSAACAPLIASVPYSGINSVALDPVRDLRGVERAHGSGDTVQRPLAVVGAPEKQALQEQVEEQAWQGQVEKQALHAEVGDEPVTIIMQWRETMAQTSLSLEHLIESTDYDAYTVHYYHLNVDIYQGELDHVLALQKRYPHILHVYFMHEWEPKFATMKRALLDVRTDLALIYENNNVGLQRRNWLRTLVQGMRNAAQPPIFLAMNVAAQIEGKVIGHHPLSCLHVLEHTGLDLTKERPLLAWSTCDGQQDKNVASLYSGDFIEQHGFLIDVRRFTERDAIFDNESSFMGEAFISSLEMTRIHGEGTVAMMEDVPVLYLYPTDVMELHDVPLFATRWNAFDALRSVARLQGRFSAFFTHECAWDWHNCQGFRVKVFQSDVAGGEVLTRHQQQIAMLGMSTYGLVYFTEFGIVHPNVHAGLSKPVPLLLRECMTVLHHLLDTREHILYPAPEEVRSESTRQALAQLLPLANEDGGSTGVLGTPLAVRMRQKRVDSMTNDLHSGVASAWIRRNVSRVQELPKGWGGENVHAQRAVTNDDVNHCMALRNLVWVQGRFPTAQKAQQLMRMSVMALRSESDDALYRMLFVLDRHAQGQDGGTPEGPFGLFDTSTKGIDRLGEAWWVIAQLVDDSGNTVVRGYGTSDAARSMDAHGALPLSHPGFALVRWHMSGAEHCDIHGLTSGVTLPLPAFSDLLKHNIRTAPVRARLQSEIRGGARLQSEIRGGGVSL